MSHWRWFLCLTLIAGSVAWVARGAAQEGPDAGRFRGDPGLQGVSPGPLPAGTVLMTLWTTVIGGNVSASPVVVDGTVYVGSWDGEFVALDATTGDRVWSAGFGGAPGSASVVDGVVYVGGMDGMVHALDAATGDEVWSTDLGGPIRGGVVVSETTVLAGSEANDLVALKARRGREDWTGATGNDIPNAPAVADGRVFVGSLDGLLYAFDADGGDELWTATLGDDGWVGSPWVVAGDGIVIAGSGYTQIGAWDAASGEVAWTAEANGNVPAAVALAGGLVYLGGDDGTVLALDAETGRERWRFTAPDGVRASPTVVGNTLVVITGEGVLLGIDAASGAERWRFAVAIENAGFFCMSAPTVVDGVVYVGCGDGGVHAIGVDPDVEQPAPTPTLEPTIAPTATTVAPPEAIERAAAIRRAARESTLPAGFVPGREPPTTRQRWFPPAGLTWTLLAVDIPTTEDDGQGVGWEIFADETAALAAMDGAGTAIRRAGYVAVDGGLGPDGACYELMQKERSQAVCYLRVGDVIVSAYNGLNVGDAAVVVENAADLARWGAAAVAAAS
jgi:outer membrane protein assembly factor BamB